uniref:Bifunctional nitrilase/nitrile hydratase NIT4A n=1 Tax=Rhizophora mucronata TaxID=61149 RepID=A0A2P2JKQ4_RHIMU
MYDFCCNFLCSKLLLVRKLQINVIILSCLFLFSGFGLSEV